jgi:RNA polymerase sigma-70 factor (ECF subfamily)
LLVPSTNNETHLLQRVANGDETAFSELYYSYHNTLGIYIYQLTQSRELSEEIVQDVFLKIWVGREALTEVNNFKAWLFVVSKNQALNALRALVKERVLQKNWTRDHQFSYAKEEAAVNDDAYILLDQAINQLPEQQKKVFILSRYRRLKYKEIAKELNLSKETVKSYLAIAVSSITKFVNSKFSPVFWIAYLFLL